MQVSFIIPLYNCLALTQTMLASLRATVSAALEHEIILVDDGSSDGTRDWLRTLTFKNDRCRVLLNEKNLGFAATCNRGASSATGTFLFFLNNDLVLLPDWLAPILTAFDRFSKAAIVGNVQLNASTHALDHAGIFFDHKGKPAHVRTSPWLARLTGYRQADAVTGACFAIRRTLWLQLGGLDEGFINGSEDVDLCLRATSRGFHNYVALRSVVLHHISSSSGRKLRDEQNTFRLVRRWRKEIAALMAPDWSRQQIAIHSDQSGVLDYAMLHEVWLYLCLLRSPPPRVRAGVEASLAREEQRWNELLESAPPLPVHLKRTEQI